MKTRSIFVASLIAALFGCDKYQRISGSEFQKQFQLRNMQTLYVGEYLGKKDGKAFMRIRSLSSITSETKETIVYSYVNELEAVFRDELLKDEKAFEPDK